MTLRQKQLLLALLPNKCLVCQNTPGTDVHKWFLEIPYTQFNGNTVESLYKKGYLRGAGRGVLELTDGGRAMAQGLTREPK